MNKTNVNTEEIEKFDKLAYRWWDPDGELKTLHHINPLRLAFIEQQIDLSGKRIIDIGCGGGLLTEALATRDAQQVLGVDMSEKALFVARQHAKMNEQLKSPIDYVQQTAEQIAKEQPGQFDLVTCMELLEHVPDPASLVQACAQLVKPGGIVCFSTLNRTPQAFALAIVGAEYVMKLLPRGTHDYAKFIRPKELDRWARQNQLSLKQLTGMAYNPLTAEAKLTPSVSVNYLASYRFIK